MKGTGQLLPIIGLLATLAGASYMVVRLGAQESAGGAGITQPAIAELREDGGQVVLRGEFVPTDEDDDELEHTALLRPAGSDTGATGTVEVEIARRVTSSQDVELEVMHLVPGQLYTFAIDGHDIATAAADRRGRIELERRVRDGHVQ